MFKLVLTDWCLFVPRRVFLSGILVLNWQKVLPRQASRRSKGFIGTQRSSGQQKTGIAAPMRGMGQVY
jgi:hypothetical protein